jgi:hypothetical protein
MSRRPLARRLSGGRSAGRRSAPHRLILRQIVPESPPLHFAVQTRPPRAPLSRNTGPAAPGRPAAPGGEKVWLLVAGFLWRYVWEHVTVLEVVRRAGRDFKSRVLSVGRLGGVYFDSLTLKRLRRVGRWRGGGSKKAGW